jgi:hypothetical protein
MTIKNKWINYLGKQTGFIPREKVIVFVSKIATSKYAWAPTYFGCIKALRMSRIIKLVSSVLELCFWSPMRTLNLKEILHCLQK